MESCSAAESTEQRGTDVSFSFQSSQGDCQWEQKTIASPVSSAVASVAGVTSVALDTRAEAAMSTTAVVDNVANLPSAQTHNMDIPSHASLQRSASPFSGYVSKCKQGRSMEGTAMESGSDKAAAEERLTDMNFSFQSGQEDCQMTVAACQSPVSSDASPSVAGVTSVTQETRAEAAMTTNAVVDSVASVPDVDLHVPYDIRLLYAQLLVDAGFPEPSADTAEDNSSLIIPVEPVIDLIDLTLDDTFDDFIDLTNDD